MRTFPSKVLSIAVAAVLFLSVNGQAQDKMSKMKKDTSKMSKMDSKKGHNKMDKMKKDTSKM